jgi:RNA polymerase sigma factor (sigma-70 family)
VSDPRQPKPLKKAEIVDFYDHASPDLHRLLARKLGNPEEAQEVAHDAFEKLLRQAEHETIRDLRRFFFTMANRMALDVLRRREVQGRFLRAQPVDDDDLHTGDNPERILIGRERLAAVQRALAVLPGKTRHIFLLHRFEGHTYAEISRQVGVSKKSVEYHMNRALMAISMVAEASAEG